MERKLNIQDSLVFTMQFDARSRVSSLLNQSERLFSVDTRADVAELSPGEPARAGFNSSSNRIPSWQPYTLDYCPGHYAEDENLIALLDSTKGPRHA
jgi:hypothetical protein